VQETLEAEMAETLGAEKGERTEARVGYRSGYYTRSLIAWGGKIEVPQDRQLALARRACRGNISAGRRSIPLHPPEVECIAKGKAHRPYEFGVKVSVATTISQAKGDQFVTHVKALPGNPCDGHTLATVIPDMEASSATSSRASSPTRDIAATARHPTTGSESSSPARS
jgi:Transposase, Mutator family